jgi:hypothetical protein
MKARYAEWARLSVRPKSATPSALPIRALDIPGFREIEDKVMLYASSHGETPPFVDIAANELSRKTFGITRRDTLFDVPERYWNLSETCDERIEIDERYSEYESQFETSDLCDEDRLMVLKRLGMDFSDERGFPLRCTRLFCRQVEAAAKGIAGKMPDRGLIGLERWASAMEADARDHLAKKGHA